MDEEAVESEMSEIYKSQQNYLELIRNSTPTPPIVEYQVRCGEVETNVYDEPIKELIIESESKETTPEYQAVPVKTLINSFEQGKSLLFLSLFASAIIFRQFRFGNINKTSNKFLINILKGFLDEKWFSGINFNVEDFEKLKIKFWFFFIWDFESFWN